MPTSVMVGIPNNSTLMVAWDPPTRANGILGNYTVRIYNQRTGYNTEFTVQSTDPRSVGVDDLGNA